MFAGDPKLGKSFVTADIAAAVSSENSLPFSEQPKSPESVVILSAEDDVSRTIKPRLRAAGADLTNVHVLESVITSSGVETFPSLKRDLESIRDAALSLTDCRLIVIDPVTAYLDGVDDYRSTQLRAVLSELKRLAEDLNVAVLLVSHLSKNKAGNSKHRVLGSIAYVGTCRANFVFMRDHE